MTRSCLHTLPEGQENQITAVYVEQRRVCALCGEFFQGRQALCPNDGRELFVIERSEDRRVGQRIDDRYTLLGILGRGGAGVVYRALQHSMEREVALKLIPPDVATDETVVRRFKLEAKSASRLVHPNIITLFDFGQTSKGELFLVMELLEGWTLRERLSFGGKIGLAEAVSIIGQVCQAIYHAHSKKVIHRDLKPENIFLIPRSQGEPDLVKVIDFGVAKVKTVDPRKPITQDGIICGTPAYMSPEQITGQEIDGRSDVYSMGCLLFEMLTGRVPFDDPLPMKVVMAHLRNPPPLLTAHWPDAPPQLVQLVRDAMDKRPDRRPQTAAIFAMRFGQLLVGDRAARRKDEPSGAWFPRTPNPLSTPTRMGGPGAEIDKPTAGGFPSMRQVFRVSSPPMSGSFVGRGRELDSLRQLCGGDHRLITVHGPAGIGKTRLVGEFLARAIEGQAEFLEGGAWFVDLAAAGSRSDLVLAMSRALDVPLSLGSSLELATDQLGHALAARGPALVVLDNFEQVVAHTQTTLGRWLNLAPSTQFLVTSRSVLGMQGEVVFELPPLSIPSDGKEIGSSEAVQLFVSKSREVRRGFELDSTNRGVVAQIVGRLDGIPLAIELAAARMSVLGPRQLLDRLDDRFSLLVGRHGDQSSRQSTLWLAIEWSWGLLTLEEQRTLAFTSVFRGGFDLEAAEAVFDLPAPGGPTSVLNLIQSLVDNALLKTSELLFKPGELRFDVYESIRHFSEKKLRQMGVEVQARETHAKHYLSVCRALSDEVLTRGGLEARHRLALEAENLSAILERSLEVEPPSRRAAEDALAALGLLNSVMAVQGVMGKSVDLFEQVIRYARDARVDAPILAGAIYGRAEARRARGMLSDAVRDYTLALELARRAGDRSREAWCLGQLGIAALHQGRIDDGIQSITSAFETYRELDEPLGMGWQLGMLGTCLYACGDLDRAFDACQEAVRILATLEDPPFQGWIQVTLGKLLQERGDFDAARDRFQRVLAELGRTGVKLYETMALGGRAGLAWEQARPQEALDDFERVVELVRTMGHRLLAGLMSGCLAAVRAELDQIDESALGFRIAESFLQPEESATYAMAVQVHRGHLDLALARRERDQGNFIAASVHVQAARDRSELAKRPTPPTASNPVEVPAMNRCSDEVRFALRMLDKAIVAESR